MVENIESYSQANQDFWVYQLFKDKKEGGFFLDIGAETGTLMNNSFMLERFFNWNGICIEASPRNFEYLIQYRRSKNVCCAVSDYNGKCKISGNGPGCYVAEEGIEVPCKTLNTILSELNCPQIIDYLSIDIEGYEYKVLKDFDFEKYFIKTITIEHNLYQDGSTNKDILYNLLTVNGFIRVVNNAVDLLNDNHWEFEDWYINAKCVDLLENPLSKIQPQDLQNHYYIKNNLK